MKKWLKRIVFGWIVLMVVIPIVCILTVSLVARLFGCTVHEGFVNPCLVGGRDMGELLYGLGMMGWVAVVGVAFLFYGAILSIILVPLYRLFRSHSQ